MEAKSGVKNPKISLESEGYGGEGVSQPPLKEKVFSTFLDQNPPFELRPENGFRFRQKPVMRCSAIGGAGVLPSEGEGSHVRIVSGAPAFLYFAMRYADPA